jgi:hypothetical protein
VPWYFGSNCENDLDRRPSRDTVGCDHCIELKDMIQSRTALDSNESQGSHGQHKASSQKEMAATVPVPGTKPCFWRRRSCRAARRKWLCFSVLTQGTQPHTHNPLSMEPYLPRQNAGESTVRETQCKQPEGNGCATVPRTFALCRIRVIRMGNVA